MYPASPLRINLRKALSTGDDISKKTDDNLLK